MSNVEAVVATTSIESGRFHAVESVIDLDSLLHLFEQFRGSAQGYLEVRSTAREFPVMTFAVQGDFVVIHCSFTSERTALLYGDGSVAPGETVEVPIMDEMGTFTGEFAVNTARARQVLEDFAHGGNPASLGEWCEL